MNISNFCRAAVFILTYAYLSLSVQAKEYTIPELRMEVSINEDGTLHITEHRTYVFDGSYSWANYKLPKAGFTAIRDIRVSESGSDFTNLNTEEAGTFLVEESSDAYNIKWYYDAEDEKRVFTISYTLEGAVVIGPEWSEFFWNYASSGREKSTELISVLVQLPESVSESELHSWVREPSWDIERTTFENGFQFRGTDIDRQQAVIIRTVFPTAVFNENRVSVTDPDFSLAWAQNDEANYREQKRREAEERERLFQLGMELTIILIGLSILAFVYLYRKYGSRHQVNLSKNESLMIPGNQKPAAIGWLLMHRNITGGHVTATLLDIARRGYLTIKEEEAEKDSWLSSKKDSFSIHLTDKEPGQNLSNWELDLLRFVKERVSGKGANMEEIFKFTDSDVSKWYSDWKKKLNTFCKDQNWIDQSSYKGAYWNLGVQILLLLAGTVGIFMLHPILSVALAVCFAALVSSLAIIRRTPKGEELYRTWKNYQRALNNAKEYSIPDHHLGLHFIYGIALGLGTQKIEQMFEQNPGAISMIHWFIILPGSTHSPADMASSFTSLAATGTISSSGGSVAGGGASAGAVGGGASGGAG